MHSSELLAELAVTWRVASPGAAPTATRTQVQAGSASAFSSRSANAEAIGSNETIRPRYPSRRSLLPYWPEFAPTSTTTVVPVSRRIAGVVSAGIADSERITSKPIRWATLCAAALRRCRAALDSLPRINASISSAKSPTVLRRRAILVAVLGGGGGGKMGFERAGL